MENLKVYIVVSILAISSFISKAEKDIPKVLPKNSLRFTENKGQISNQNYEHRKDVLFSGETSGLNFFIRNDGISFQTTKIETWKKDENELASFSIQDSIPDKLKIYRTDINWLGFNKNFTVETGKPFNDFANYYLPSCPDGALNVNSYSTVTFKNLYDGIDLKWYEKNGELEYDFIIKPGADFKNIKWEIKGATNIVIGDKGQLIIKTPLGEIEEVKPIAFQENEIIETKWQLNGNIVSFKIDGFDPTKVLTIDPIIKNWATYLGGLGQDYIADITSDSSENCYVAGQTNSIANIATAGAFQTSLNNVTWDGFFGKFDANGSIEWATYFGSAELDVFTSINSDKYGNSYLLGITQSTNGLSTAGAYKANNNGSSTGIIAKFDNNGQRIWSTYFGGPNNDNCIDLHVYKNKVLIIGNTQSSSGISTPNSHQSIFGGGMNDAFIANFDTTGALIWASYYGGPNIDYGSSISTDNKGNILFAGYTLSSSGISTIGSHKQTISSGSYDIFFGVFDQTGNRKFASYFGGNDLENRPSFISDNKGNYFLAGSTESTQGISSIGAYQNFGGGSRDAFIARFDSLGALIWGTYLGGSNSDAADDLKFGFHNHLVLVGSTNSTNGISSISGLKPTKGGNLDGFICVFDTSGKRLYGTYFGGQNDDNLEAISISNSNKILISGYTLSTDSISSTGSYQVNNNGGQDGFITSFSCFSVLIRDSIKICKNDGFISPSGKVIFSEGILFDTTTSSLGCDSIFELFIKINSRDIVSKQINICNKEIFTSPSGKIFSENGIYFDTLQSVIGCDSIIEFDVNIQNLTIDSLFHSVDTCSKFRLPSGKLIHQSGSFMDTIINIFGCDSLIKEFKVEIDTIIPGINIISGGMKSNDSLSIYQWLNCGANYSEIQGETNRTFYPKSPGLYSLEISKKGCIDTSSCYLYPNLGAGKLQIHSDLIILPNPFKNSFTINFKNFKKVEIYSSEGKLIKQSFTQNIDGQNLSKGIYLIKIFDSNNNFTLKKVVKI